MPMKKIPVIIVALLLFVQARANERVNITISKPLCLLTFLQAAAGTGNVAPSLSQFIKDNVPAKDTEAFNFLVNDFSSIGFDYSYVFPDYPEKRQHPKTVINLITIAAVQSGSIDEFMGRIVGVLPNEQWLRLKNVMKATEPFYDRLVITPYQQDIQHQLKSIARLGMGADSMFAKLKVFYGSTWSDDMPFTICIYPVPGTQGSTTATPHSNCLVLAVMTGERDYHLRIGIAMHEVCHVLYEEQPLALQLKTDTCFNSNLSAYAQYAYGYIDEALATACGNGWVYKTLTGQLDKSGWYADDYIDGYAHAIYPLVTSYVEHGKTMDKPFIDSAINLFVATFPDAIYDYKCLMNRVNLYTDASNHEQYEHISSLLRKYYRISSCSGSYPINDPLSLDMLNTSTGTQCFIVYGNQDKNYELLKSKYPQLSTLSAAQEGVYSFTDDKKRPVIVINVSDIDRIDAGLKTMSKAGKIKPEKIFTAIR
jgi:hypothetical protein